MASETGATKIVVLTEDQHRLIWAAASATATRCADSDHGRKLIDAIEAFNNTHPGALLFNPEAVAALRLVLERCDEFEDMQAFDDIASERKMLRAALEGSNAN